MLIFLLSILDNEDDRILLESIYKEYADLLNYVAGTRLFNNSSIDDCVQETFVELIKSFDNFKKVTEEKRKPYIMKICERVIYKMNNDNLDIVSYEETTDNNYSDESEFDFSAFDRIAMAQIIKDLDPLYRVPLLLKYSSGYSAGEISEMLGISANLVYQRIHRGKSILYDSLVKE